MAKVKHYISDEDRLLKTFDHEHPELSDSQAKEIDKHARLAKQRDTADTTTTDQVAIWDDF